MIALSGAAWGKATFSPGIEAGGKSVRGSCSESYIPIFAAARAVQFDSDYARIALKVDAPRDPETGRVTAATVSVAEAEGLSPAAQAAITDGVRRAYLAAEPAECVGVITNRSGWVLRFGEAQRLAAPDNPLVFNRATATARMLSRTGNVELQDPATGVTRLTLRPGSAESGDQMSCFTGELWRDFGPPPPVQLMQRGERYRLRFIINADGQAQDPEIQPTDGGAAPTGALRAALEAYVRQARFYPPITETCRPRNAAAVLVVGRD
jgi:hypothetical protein